MFEIGTTLREARLRRQVDLVEAEQDTKIRSKYLAALETEDFDLLPGAVYVRGFLRTYTRYLGLDAQLYIDEYNERFGRFEEIDEASSPVLSRPGHDLLQRRGPFTLRRVAVGCLVLLAGLSWFGLRSEERTPPTQPDGVVAASEPDPFTDAASDAAAIARGSAQGRKKPAVAAVPRMVVRARGGDSWIEVRAGGAQGPVRYSGTLRQGMRKGFPGPRLYVTVGVAAVAEVRSGRSRVIGRGAGTTHYLVTPGRVRHLP
jgi:cytoskeleton protein RodZ